MKKSLCFILVLLMCLANCIVTGGPVLAEDEGYSAGLDFKKKVLEKYPIVNSTRVQAFRETAVFEVYLTSPEVPEVYVIKDAEGQRIRLSLGKSMITQEKQQLPGNQVFLSTVILRENRALTEYLDLIPPYYAVDEYIFKFLEPVEYKLEVKPSVIKIEFKVSKKAELNRQLRKQALERQFKSRDNLRSVGGILGAPIQEQDYFSDVVSGRVDRFNTLENIIRHQRKIEAETYVNEKLNLEALLLDEYSSDELIRAYLKKKYPKFGSIDYWKKHISGVIGVDNYWSSNYDKDGRIGVEPEGAVVSRPSASILFRRTGVTELTAGYNVSKEFVFFNKNTKVNEVDVDQNYTFGINRAIIEASPYPRFFYSVQTAFRQQDNPFGDRGRFGRGSRDDVSGTRDLNIALGFLYLISQKTKMEGGVGYRWDLLRNEGNFSTGLANFVISHEFTRRLTGYLEYSYSDPFMQNGFNNASFRQSGNNMERIHNFGLRAAYDYGETTLSAGMKAMIIDTKFVFLPLGSMHFRHKLTPRMTLSANIINNINRNTTGRRFTVTESGEREDDTESKVQIVWYQEANASLQRQMTPSLNGRFGIRYSRLTDVPGVKSSQDVDKYDNFGLFVSLVQQLVKQRLSCELRYQLDYYREEARDDNPVHQSSASSTGSTSSGKRNSLEHRIFLKFFYYFGKGGA